MNNSKEITIAIDAMGGDRGTSSIIKGASFFFSELPLAAKERYKLKFIFLAKR